MMVISLWPFHNLDTVIATKCYMHDMEAVLPCFVQQVVVVWWPVTQLQKYNYSSYFNYVIKIVKWVPGSQVILTAFISMIVIDNHQYQLLKRLAPVVASTHHPFIHQWWIDWLVHNGHIQIATLQCTCNAFWLSCILLVMKKNTADNQKDLTHFPPRATYLGLWNVSALVPVMACCLFSAEPSPEPLLIYCQLDLKKWTSVTFESKYKTFQTRKCILICCLLNGSHIFQGGGWINRQ